MIKNINLKYLVIVFIVIFIFTFLYNWFFQKNIDETIYIKVNRGESLEDVLYKMDQKGLNFSHFYAKLYYKLFPKQINAGDYFFKNDLNLINLSEILAQGFLNGIKITIPEGFRFKEIKKRLSKKDLIDETIFQNLFKDEEFINSLGIKSTTLEGYLYPDTYYFVKSNTEKEIIKRMHLQLKEILEKNKLLKKIKDSNFTLKEILTLASLVEWEAQIDKERDIIAQVFIRRLKISKPLESCASIEYALDKHKKKLYREDLKVKSPFNTYENYGLPPTPINNPGIKSIKAVLNPADTDYLYFVSKNDGTHVFSKSYNEHVKAKRKYQSW